jgi:uncharacterized protein (TIGR02246 family)
MRPFLLQTGLAPADATAIQNMIDGLVAAWNTGNGHAYGSAFTENCDYVTFNGERIRGRKAVADSHQALFDTHLRDSKLLFESVDMRPLGPETILVHGVGNSLLRGQKKYAPSRRSLQTLIAVRTDAGWRFAAFHNTRIFKITPFRALLMMLGA